MIFQILGYCFGFFMALHYYFLLILIPAIIESFFGNGKD